MVNWPNVLATLIGGGITFIFAFIFRQQFINYKTKKDLNEAFKKIRKIQEDWQSPLGNYKLKE